MVALFIVIVALSAVIGGKWIAECYRVAFDKEAE